MAESPNLLITHVAAGQRGKTTTINQAFDALDAATQGVASVTIEDLASVFIDLPDYYEAFFIRVQGSTASDASLIVPDGNRFFCIANEANRALQVDVLGGSDPVSVPNGEVILLMARTGAIRAVGGPNEVYDIGGGMPGSPQANEVVLGYVAPRPFTLPAGASASRAQCITSATATTVFSIQRDGSTWGTITFPPDGIVGTFIASAAVPFVAGERLTVVAPDPADATLADLFITLACER
jgi:hypothetical protein